MLNFIIRRTLYSVFVIIGVLILTFVFFRISAGDPAAALLGKSPSPVEIENLRGELSADKPIFYGHWKKTESFTSASFAEKFEFPGVAISGTNEMAKGFIRIKSGSVNFSRNFTPPEKPVIRTEIIFRGQFEMEGKTHSSSDWQTLEVEIPPGQNVLVISIPDANSAPADIKSVSFFKKQDFPFDSQFISAIKEVISFKKDFPFVSLFNFGKTLLSREEIRTVLLRCALPSLMLMIPVFLGEMILGVALALISTAFRGKWPDRLIVLLSVAGMSISYLVFIIAGQWYLGYYFNWFPVWGYGSWRFFALPILVGVLSGLGEGVRFYRTIFVNELNREYLRTAAAKGCSPFTIYCKHLLANAAIPLITRATAILPFLFTGSLLLESFFGIPGLGYTGINAVMNADLQMVKALVVLTAFIFVIINLFADITYAWADPRIRLK